MPLNEDRYQEHNKNLAFFNNTFKPSSLSCTSPPILISRAKQEFSFFLITHIQTIDFFRLGEISPDKFHFNFMSNKFVIFQNSKSKELNS